MLGLTPRSDKQRLLSLVRLSLLYEVTLSKRMCRDLSSAYGGASVLFDCI